MKNRSITFAFIVVATILLSFINDHSTDCKRVKNGQFYYFAKKTGERVKVVRMDSVQLETSDAVDSDLIKSKIVWRNDCEFEMFINALSDKKLTGFDSVLATTPAYINIIYVGNKFYVCTAKITIADRVINIRDTLYYLK